MHPAESNPFAGRIVIASRPADILAAQQSLAELLAIAGHAESVRYVVRAALEEALVNAMVHGNRNDPSRQVVVEYAVADAEVVIDVTDEGRGFDPRAVPDPTRPENVHLPSGRGITLMRSFMSEVEFRSPGNRVRLVYRAEE